MPVQVGAVVNHFSEPADMWVLEQSTRLTLAMLRRCPEVESIVLADGSLAPSEDLRGYCATIDAAYLHEEGGMSYARGWNAGFALLDQPWVAMLASDVYVFPDTFTKFSQFLERQPALKVGCLVPYLNVADIVNHEGLWRRDAERDALASLMSFNLIVFRSEVLARVGGVPDFYSGCYADVELALRTADAGYGVYLVGGARALHYNHMTRIHGERFDYESDLPAFQANHPDLRSVDGPWGFDLSKIVEHPALRAASRLIATRNRLRRRRGLPPDNRPYDLVLRLIPRLQRVRR
jgi:GT2 family glycosyltransferase